jgi:predicted hydrocarbon binding protein
VAVRESVFCTVREPVPHPLCGFYAAAFTRLHALFDISTRIQVVSCRGTGGTACQMSFSLVDNRAEEGAA